MPPKARMCSFSAGRGAWPAPPATGIRPLGPRWTARRTSRGRQGSLRGAHSAGPESPFASAGRTSATRRRDRNVVALLLRGQAERPGAPAAIYLHRLFYIGPPPPGAAVSGLEWMTAQVADFMEAHCVPEITVEANGVGGFLPGQLGAVLATRGQGLRALPHITKDKKEERIASVFAGLFSSPNFFVHASVRATPFLAELAAWRPGGAALRDDGMDAVAIAFRDYLPGDALPRPRGLPRSPRYAWQTAAYPGTGTFNAGPAFHDAEAHGALAAPSAFPAPAFRSEV